MYANNGTPNVAVKLIAQATQATSLSDNGDLNGDVSDCKRFVTGDVQPDSNPKDNVMKLAGNNRTFL